MNDTEQQPEPIADTEPSATKTNVVDAVKAYVTDLLTRVDPTAQIQIHQDGRRLFLELQEATGFVGFEGASIQALEHLVDLHLRRHLREDSRIRVDIDNFRHRRTEELKLLAQTSAEQAMSDFVRVKLDPMTAWERKTVHEALEDVENVRTHSEGNLERFVVIAPQKRRPKETTEKIDEKRPENESEPKS
jgi:spoIIIJ-associated protein